MRAREDENSYRVCLPERVFFFFFFPFRDRPAHVFNEICMLVASKIKKKEKGKTEKR